MTKIVLIVSGILAGFPFLQAVTAMIAQKPRQKIQPAITQVDTPEYFNLRPKLEKEYGYSHAVRMGDEIIISGAVSMNDSRDYCRGWQHGATDEKLLQ